MNKKLLSLAAAILLGLGISFATNYGLYVGGTQVTSSNASNIATGVWFDETSHTLFLNGATINGTSSKVHAIDAEASLNNLNIVVIGNTATRLVGYQGGSGLHVRCNTTISGPGTLNAYLNSSAAGGDGICVDAGNLTITDGVTVKASAKGLNYGGISGDYGSNTLTINNANVICYAPTGSNGVIYAFGSVTFNGVTLNPSGATYNTSAQELRNGSSTICDTFKATINGGYGLWIAGKYIMSSGTITGTGISGSVSYDPSSSTLTLNGATINTTSYDGIYAKNQLNISLSGNNRIESSQKTGSGIWFKANSTITGPGTLEVSGWDAIDGGSGNLTISNCTLKAFAKGGGNYGPICGGRDLTINNANVTAAGGGQSPIYWWNNLTLNNCSITKPEGAVYNNNSSNQYIEYNGSEYTDTLVITASSQSIQIANESQFALYPNPATNNVRIASDATIEQVEIINVAGVVVMKEYLNNNSTMLNVEKLNNGIYAVRVRTNKGISIQRMVVSR